MKKHTIALIIGGAAVFFGAGAVLSQGTGRTSVVVGPTTASMSELIARVRTLEQAVVELQGGTYVGTGESTTQIATWTCKVQTRKDYVYGSGISRGMAEKDGMEKCYQAQGEGAFCKVETCSN